MGRRGAGRYVPSALYFVLSRLAVYLIAYLLISFDCVPRICHPLSAQRYNALSADRRTTRQQRVDRRRLLGRRTGPARGARAGRVSSIIPARYSVHTKRPYIGNTESNRGTREEQAAGCEEYGRRSNTRATHTPCSPSLCRLSAAASLALHLNIGKRSCSSAARREPAPPRARFTSGTAIATPPRVPIVLALTGRGQKSSGSTALEAKSKGQA